MVTWTSYLHATLALLTACVLWHKSWLDWKTATGRFESARQAAAPPPGCIVGGVALPYECAKPESAPRTDSTSVHPASHIASGSTGVDRECEPPQP